ncbi:MAG TPA: GNAT family N-acetyltransferase [Solirubrobacteraceae bacterium]
MTDPLADRRTERLRLRRIEDADLDALVALSTDPRVNAHRPGGAPTAEQAADIIGGFIADWERSGVGYWAAEYEGRIVGVAGVRLVTLGDRECWNLYYRFAPEVQGQGLASEAARAAISAAREHDSARTVVARTRPDNAAAIGLALAVGMTRRAELDAGGFVTYAI